MGLSEQLMEDLKDAMRKHDEIRVSTIRFARAAITNEQIEKRRPLEESEIVGVLAKQVKQRRESIEEFQKGNRPDLVAKEQAEMEILLSYLPKQMTREEIEDAARATIQEVGATSANDFGKVMSRLAPQLRGRADGKVIGEVVRGLLH
ncbi:MAG TPA: GatB/YqeY domain-containing protein [Chloroflexota bacterium]|nr:GatB/YqeY domain-containing protein [Chloroflexota bacterium]